MTDDRAIHDAIKAVRNQAFREVLAICNELKRDPKQEIHDSDDAFVRGHRHARRQIYAAVERLMGTRE